MPPVLTVPAVMTVEATGPTGAVANFTATAVDNSDPNPTVTCTPASGATFPLGSTPVTCTARDASGNTATGGFTVTVVDTTAPTVTVPGDVTATATSRAGAVAAYPPASGRDLVAGPLPATCAPVSGSMFGLGQTLVTCTATDPSGNTGSAQFRVTVTYARSGVLQPVNADGTSIFKAGSTVPVKFALTGASAPVTTATARLSYAKISNGIEGTVVEATSNVAATTGNLFRYDGGQYIYNWSTKGLTPGTYSVKIDLGDGAPHAVTISLK